MPEGSKIFVPCRSLGYVSNHLPLQVRYIRMRNEHLITTCVGKSFHTYGISHFGLLSVSNLHTGDIDCIAGDTYHIYTACKNVIYAWRRGTELKHTYKGHRKTVHLMLPFGAHLISIDESSHINIWDIKNEKIFFELTFNNETFRITTLMHPATYINKILLGSEQGEMQLWNINSSKLIYKFKGWQSPVTCVEQAPALDVVAVGLQNGKIIIHNLRYDETIMEFMQDWGKITTIAFRTDGAPVMATGSTVGHIVFWDLEERRVLSQLLRAHDAPVTGMECIPNEPLILTSSPDNTLKLWIFDKSDGGARLLRIREGHSAPPNCIRFHGANGHNILSSASDSTLRIFNTQTEQFNKSLGKASYNRKASKKKGRLVEDPLIMPPIVNFTSETTREKEWDNIAAIHQGLTTVTTWSYDRIKMGELKLLHERFKKVRGEVAATCISLTHCGNFVVVGYSSGHVDRFNIQSGAHRDTYGEPKAHDSSVRGVSVDTLNRVVVSGGSDRRILFWHFKCKGSKPLTTLWLDEPVSFFRSHPDSGLIAIAVEDFAVCVLDITARRIVRRFIGHTAPLTDATFSPDARRLVTASMDRSVRTWDVPAGLLVDQFATDVACVALDWSPTGEMLATAHVDALGVFLWSNRTLYARITLKAISPEVDPPMVTLPDCTNSDETVEEYQEAEPEDLFISREQLEKDLVTLSGLSTSRWLNLLDIETIRQRNKPKQAPKASEKAPFFLPTVPALNMQFYLSSEMTRDDSAKILKPLNFINLTPFGKVLDTGHFPEVLDKLKSLGPSMIEFEIKSLSPDNGGTSDVMLQFMKFIEYVLKTNRDFELAEAYLSVFLKNHGNTIASEESLRTYLTNIQSCHGVMWKRLQEKLMYNLCVVQNLKTM